MNPVLHMQPANPQPFQPPNYAPVAPVQPVGTTDMAPQALPELKYYILNYVRAIE